MATLLFDLDGTLVNSGDDLVATVNHTLSVLHLPSLDRGEILSYVGDGVQMLVKRSLAASHNPQKSFEEALEIFMTYYRQNCTTCTTFYPGALDCLATLQHEHTLAVVTNKSEELARRILEKLGATSLFSAVVGGDTLSVKKPNPAVIHHLVSTLTKSLDTMVMIGDHHTDLATAEAAKIPSIFCTYGMGHTDGIIPTASVDTFCEIPAALAKILV